MKIFIQKTIKPFLIISGIITASIIQIAISPDSGLERALQLEFSETYKILIQHWSLMIFLVGLFLVLSAFITTWRFPIIVFATVEKIFIVVLYLTNRQYEYSEGFLVAAIIDTIIVIYFLIYFVVEYKERNKS